MATLSHPPKIAENSPQVRAVCTAPRPRFTLPRGWKFLAAPRRLLQCCSPYRLFALSGAVTARCSAPLRSAPLRRCTLPGSSTPKLLRATVSYCKVRAASCGAQRGSVTRHVALPRHVCMTRGVALPSDRRTALRLQQATGATPHLPSGSYTLQCGCGCGRWRCHRRRKSSYDSSFQMQSPSRLQERLPKMQRGKDGKART